MLVNRFLILCDGCQLNLNYNELKLLILRTISEGGSMSSEEVAARLVTTGARVEIHAVRMALVRYYRQGLLLRKKAGGSFSYSLSDRGLHRFEWLEAIQKRSRSPYGR